MNIADKNLLCAEAARVLRPGSLFAIYDVMRIGHGRIVYPVPWADTEEISFLHPPHEYRQALQTSGFEILREVDRRQWALEFFQAMRGSTGQSTPPSLSLHVLMGRTAPLKIANMIAGFESGAIAPVEIVARRS
jgi:hypothetical protein